MYKDLSARLEAMGVHETEPNRLWRQSDDKTFDDKSARDEEQALELFGQELGVPLTLTEGPAAPRRS